MSFSAPVLNFDGPEFFMCLMSIVRFFFFRIIQGLKIKFVQPKVSVGNVLISVPVIVRRQNFCDRRRL